MKTHGLRSSFLIASLLGDNLAGLTCRSSHNLQLYTSLSLSTLKHFLNIPLERCGAEMLGCYHLAIKKSSLKNRVHHLSHAAPWFGAGNVT